MNIELCRAEEVAHALGIELDTLYRYARKGRIRGMKVGKSWRFLKTDIQEFLQQHQYHVKTAEYPDTLEVKPTLLPDILRRAALQHGPRCAITSGSAKASYADLDKASNSLADCLLGHGVVPGDRVLILLANSLEFLVSCFAAWKAGAIVVAEDPAIQDAPLSALMNNCSPQALIADRPVAQRLDVLRHPLDHLRVVYVKGQTFHLSTLAGLRVESLDTVLESESSPALLRFNSASPDDAATITYNAGAAERPSGVVNSHESWLAGAFFFEECLGLTKHDVLLLPLPMHQSMALRQALACIAAGAQVVLAPDLESAVKSAKGLRPTALALRGGDAKLLKKHSPALRNIAASLRYVQVDGAPLESGELEALQCLLPGLPLHACCNLTEAQAAFLEAGPGPSLNRLRRLPPTLALHVVDGHLDPLPPGQSGRILVRGPGLFKGLWGQSQHELAMLALRGYCTPDKAATGKQGQITLLGRLKETLTIHGQEFAVADIEKVLRRHVRVAECAVVGLFDMEDGFETRMHAFVVPTAKGAMLTERELKGYCRSFLPTAKIPARIHIQASLPKSADGQIARDSLKAAAHRLANSPRRLVSSAASLATADSNELAR